MHEHKTLVVLEALIKCEDKLLGRKFIVVTNHKGLEYFKSQLNLFPRQTRWWEYLSHFNDNTIHVDGTCVKTQTQTHAQIHTHAQIPAYVQLPTLFQPRVPS